MAGVDWQHDVDAAFAAARAAYRPVLLYWGARWCPPCNRLKAVVFDHPAFVRAARSLVALHVDGDQPGAQRLAERLRLRSYPTLVLYRPDGTQVTRLPGELDGERFAEILELALASRHTAGESLAAALSGERRLSDDEWRLLGHYSWDTDEGVLTGSKPLDQLAPILAGATTNADAALRLDWLGLQSAAAAGHACADRGAAAGRISNALSDARIVRTHMDLVIGCAATLVRYLTDAGSHERNTFALHWSVALATLEDDPDLNVADRLASVRARVRLARLSHPPVDLREQAILGVAHALALANDPSLRHAVVNTAAGLLIEAGAPDEAERLLLAELEQSHSPYYFMHTLASLAKKRGEATAAVEWYEMAWNRADGSATRLQWGATWLQGLADLTGHDKLRIEHAATVLAAEIAANPDAACQRNRTQLGRMRTSLAALQADGEAKAALQRAIQAIIG